ncbi:hypothetical protein PUN28_017309 [Cardiocondyla obscurior]|uniref:Uncharacterized protein n=1 Tax=Cardiocondyla obscurior TaxID=286306 RepID=A0AAW2ERQ6_9HYME
MTVTGAGSYALILSGSYHGGISSGIRLPRKDFSGSRSSEDFPTKLSFPKTFFTRRATLLPPPSLALTATLPSSARFDVTWTGLKPVREKSSRIIRVQDWLIKISFERSNFLIRTSEVIH